MSELKPCPFCGSKARLTNFFGEPTIACTRCPAIMFLDHVDEKLDLIIAWNNRDSTEFMKHYRQGLNGYAISALVDAPAETERKKGNWIQTALGVQCSQCCYKCQSTGLLHFCPNCGARMGGMMIP